MTTKIRIAKAVPVVNPLTPRERQLLAALAEGDNRISIALQWGVSVGTIQNHVRLIHARLGAKTTEQAIAIAFRNGFLK